MGFINQLITRGHHIVWGMCHNGSLMAMKNASYFMVIFLIWYNMIFHIGGQQLSDIGIERYWKHTISDFSGGYGIAPVPPRNRHVPIEEMVETWEASFLFLVGWGSKMELGNFGWVWCVMFIVIHNIHIYLLCILAFFSRLAVSV